MALYFASAPYQEAEVCIVGVGLDRSGSFQPGVRFAPNQIRLAMENIESYSPFQNRDLTELKICDLGDLELTYENMATTFGQIERRVGEVVARGKKLVVLGGEHTITVPIVKVLKGFYPDLKVVQLDAHADLRDQYLGERFCHATVMRRVLELLGKERVFQVGVRSHAQEEQGINLNLYLVEVLKNIPELKQKIGQAAVYLTLDVDILDCGLLPAVGTPEPGGVSYTELRQALFALKDLNWVGADIVEYNPVAAPHLAYGCMVASLLRETVLAITKKQR